MNVEIKPGSIIVNTSEDKIALQLGRAIIQAEMRKGQLEQMQAALAEAEARIAELEAVPGEPVGD